MQVNIAKFMQDAGIEEQIYPGKRLVKRCPQPGEYKSHSVVIDWRDPDLFQIKVKAGQSGKVLPPELLKKYPVSFQSPTYVNISVKEEDLNDNEEEQDEDEEGESSASGKGGGKGQKKKKKPETEPEEKKGVLSAFSEVIEGKIPELGKVTEMVVMGMQISERAYERVLDAMTHQIEKGKVVATELLAEGGKFITRYTPPSFMKPKGNENAQYTYDREKIEPMFGAIAPR